MKTKDLMTTGAYAALYFICVGLGTLLGALLSPAGNMLMAPACIGLLGGLVYLLLIARVGKFGAISLVATMMAIFFFMSGYFVLSFVPSLFCGLVADVLAKFGKYRSKGLNLLSYVVFSFGNLGPIILMWLSREAYIQRLLDKGKDMAYVNRVLVDFNWGNVIFIALTIILGATIGGLFGQHLLKKHFSKAGLVG